VQKNVDDADKYYIIEQKNLVQLLKLSIKNFIDFALSLTSGLEEEEGNLYQLFVVLEQILKHGLKEKNGLFIARTDFFNVIQIVSKDLEWTKDLLESITNMSFLRTFTGRGRAFLRLTMMQKKTHIMFAEISNNLDKVRTLYHPHALLLAEEAHIISGLLVGLNVIDCNLCLRDRDLDSLPQVVQLSRYLKDGNYLDTPTPPPSPLLDTHKQDYQNILEQKSYVEEINEKLRMDFLVVDKKSKMFQQDNDMLMKEVQNMKSRIEELTSERDCMRQKMDTSENTYQRKMEVEKADIAVERETYEASRQGLNELYLLAKEELVKTNNRATDLERDIDIERRIKSDLEKANGLLDKELLDKEDTIEALRKQCSDVKKLNLSMLNKVQESDKKLAERNVSLKDMESRTHQSSSEMTDLVNRTKELDIENEDLKKELDDYKKKCYEMETTLDTAVTGCSVEKEWRENLQKQNVANREEIARLRTEVTHVTELKSALKQLQRENDDLRRSCSEQEQALVELGDHLSKSKVKAEELKHDVEMTKENKWVSDKEQVSCQQCKKNFSVSRRRHHCRNCGGIFCHQCSDNTMPLPSSSRPLRVCDGCADLLLQRSVVLTT